MTTNDTNNMLKNQEKFNTSDEYVKSDDTNLTEKWEAGKLKNGWYWVKTVHGFIQPMYYLVTRVKGELVKGFAEEPEDRAVEVLSPCDYDHFVDLTEKVKTLEKDIKTLTNNYKILEDFKTGHVLVDVGDYAALSEELQRLRKIERKYNNIKVKGNYPDKISKLKSRIKHLLERQANQDKEVENLIELLKECKNIVAHDCWQEAQFSDGQVVERQKLLIRINAAIGESEEE